MERLEIVSVVLIGLGALLVANPAFLGVQNEPGSVVITADRIDTDTDDVRALANRSDAVVYDATVVDFAALTGPEQDLVGQATRGGGGVRLTRTQYRSVYQNATTLDYLRPRGYLYVNGTVLETRLQRGGQQGVVFTVKRTDEKTLIGDPTRMNASLAAAVERVRDGGAPVDDETAVVTGYDFLLIEGDVYRPVVTGATDAADGGGDATGGGNVSDGGNATDGVSRGNVTLERSEAEAIYDEAATPLDELPGDGRSQVERAIADGSYDTGNSSVGRLQTVSLVRADDGYYGLSFGSEPPSLLEALDTANIVGVLLGLLMLVSGLYYARVVYRRKTAEWP